MIFVTDESVTFQVYQDSISKLYDREMKEFMEQAKMRLQPSKMERRGELYICFIGLTFYPVNTGELIYEEYTCISWNTRVLYIHYPSCVDWVYFIIKHIPYPRVYKHMCL